jgi:hypothetical protein
MTTYAGAHLRSVDVGPAIVDYPRRADATPAPFEPAILVDGVEAGHRATDVPA